MKERSPRAPWTRQASNRAGRTGDAAGGAGFADFGPGNSDVDRGPGRRRGLGQWNGPRWVVPVRSLVVVLAMVAAALGVLWIESAGVQTASAQLVSDTAGKVAVPPLDASAVASSSGAVASANAVDPAMGAAGSSPSTGDAGGAAGGDAHPGGATGEMLLVVHVVGAVKNPGVFSLDPGSRVSAAVEAAGGALPSAELAALNLAAPLLDGVQVFIPTQEQAAALQPFPGAVRAPEQSPGVVGSAQSGTQGKLNLNTASAAELETLPGVGPVLAERIVTWRTEHGQFATVDALDAVAGIGAKLLAGLRDSVTV